MTKPTLNDFYKNPRKAYAKGFRLKWKHSFIYWIEFTFKDAFIYIFDSLKEICIDCLIPILANILKILITISMLMTMPIFFPFWVIVHQLGLRKKIKKYFGEEA